MGDILKNAAKATIAQTKLTNYLLSTEHEQGKAKANFLMKFGFDPGQPEVLEASLMKHCLTRHVSASRISAHGEVFTVKCEIDSPDGRNPCIQAVWIVNLGETSPKLVTVIPRA